jgi:hypothetical protein
MIGWGGNFQVTGLGCRESAVQPSAAGSSYPRLMAEMPEPEFPMPVAVTRHLSECLSRLEVGLTSLGQPRLSEGAQPYPRQPQHLFRFPVSP